MKKPVIAVGLGTVALFGAAGLVWTGVIPSPIDNSRGAIAACIEKTQEELRSPSSFKLIWSDYTARDALTPDEWSQLSQAERDKCLPNCGEADAILRAYTETIKSRGPKLAERLRNGAKLSPDDEHIANLWIEEQGNLKANASRAAQNLPRDRTAHVTLEYDADNGFGTSIRNFAMCRFGAIGDDGQFQRADILLSGPIDASAGRQAKELQKQIDSQ